MIGPAAEGCAQNPSTPGDLILGGFGRTPDDDAGSDPMVPVFPHRALRAWPNPGARPVHYAPLSRVLSDPFASDVHFGMYSVPEHPFRLRRDAYAQMQTAPRMALQVYDVDSRIAHLTREAATDDWWAAERAKLDALLASYPGAFIYRTRGGYRIVYRTPDGVLITDEQAALDWRLRYVRRCTALARDFGIVADPTCKSWVWTFRAPRATRDGHVEDRETMGDPKSVSAWTYVSA